MSHSELAYQDMLEEEATAFAEREYRYKDAEQRKQDALDKDYG